MDPCPFVRIIISNLALKFTEKHKPSSSSSMYYCKFKLNGFPDQVSDNISSQLAENDAVESRIHSCFSLSKIELEKLTRKSSKKKHILKIEIYSRGKSSSSNCVFFSSMGKLLGRVDVELNLESGRRCVVQNGWISAGASGLKLHLNVRAEPDPRFVFLFDGEPECSPQVFQVNGSVKQPVFTCKFGLRNEQRGSRSRSCFSEPSPSFNCLHSFSKDSKDSAAPHDRKGWSVTIHDLSGSPVAAASMVTPFVPSPGTDAVSRSNPGAWLILRPDQSCTWRPWGRLEAWRESADRLGYKFDLIPDGCVDSIPLANSSVITKTRGKFTIDITTGPSPLTSPNSSFDLGSTGWGSGSDLGSASGSGSWAGMFYRGFVMSSTVGGGGRPEVEVGVQHVSCTEDAAAFVALAAAMDLSVDACRLFSKKLRKELRHQDLE